MHKKSYFSANFTVYMQKLWILGVLCLFTSCNWFTSREEKTLELVNQEMQTIDWNEIDQYPLFANCDELVSKKFQRECFEKTLLKHFSDLINEFEFELDSAISDTINVDFLIDKEGGISVLDIEKNVKIEAQIPEFNGIIIQGLKGLPVIAPALKRGIPVATKFRFPIVLSTK